MIDIENIEHVREHDYDEVWAIVRKLKSNPGNFRHVKDLSPSLELLNTFIELRENGEWNKQAFDEIYLPRFLKEIKDNEHARELLYELYDRDASGERIALTCFCDDENICHRSIVAGILQGMDANVVTKTGNDYSRYYEMYSSL